MRKESTSIVIAIEIVGSFMPEIQNIQLATRRKHMGAISVIPNVQTRVIYTLAYLILTLLIMSIERFLLDPVQTIEMKVHMDCDGCERKAKKSVSSMKGVQSMDVNRKQQKLMVIGYVDVKKVVKRVKGTEIWTYMPYNLVYHPYTAQSYDKKAPSDYVHNVESSFLSPPNCIEEIYTTIFSQDNVNVCTIM